jgi:hypothetical protein
MERQAWLAEGRAALVAVYDAEAAIYGDDEYPWDVQREWVARMLGMIPPGGMVLDAWETAGPQGDHRGRRRARRRRRRIQPLAGARGIRGVVPVDEGPPDAPPPRRWRSCRPRRPANARCRHRRRAPGGRAQTSTSVTDGGTVSRPSW